MIKELCIGSGGEKIPALMGGALALRDNGLLKELETIAGSSAGAIVATLALTGVTCGEVVHGMYILANVVWDFDISSLFTRFGVIAGHTVFVKLEDFICEHTGLPKGFTFSQLHAKYPVRLVITGYNVTNSKTDYFDYASYPNMCVIDALRISCSIPFLFQSCMYNDCMYVDGGCVDGIPLSCVGEGATVIQVGGGRTKNTPTSFRGFIDHFVQRLSSSSREEMTDVTKYRIISVDFVDVGYFEGLGVLDFDLLEKCYYQSYNEVLSSSKSES